MRNRFGSLSIYALTLGAGLISTSFPGGAQAPTPGSLFRPGANLADSSRDVRASQVGDIVTILVSENVSAVASGATNASRKSSATANVTSLAGVSSVRIAKLGNLLGTSGNQSLQGSGQTSRNMTVTTTLSALVVGVTPAGNLLVQATKDISVNSERQTMVVEGMVRPEDLTSGNVVQSQQVADLQVHVNGKGVVGDAVRRPHGLYRLLLGLLPF